MHVTTLSKIVSSSKMKAKKFGAKKQLTNVSVSDKGALPGASLGGPRYASHVGEYVYMYFPPTPPYICVLTYIFRECTLIWAVHCFGYNV